MGVYGLIGAADLKTTMKKMSKFECEDYLIVDKEMTVKEILKESIEQRQIKVIELLNIVDLELSNAQLYELFTEFFKRNIKVQVIEKIIEVSDQEYLEIIYHVLKRDYDHRSNIQKIKLKEARNKGVVLGRPSLTKNEIKEILDLREKHSLTYREISVKTGASLGTVSKYCKEAKMHPEHF